MKKPRLAGFFFGLDITRSAQLGRNQLQNALGILGRCLGLTTGGQHAQRALVVARGRDTDLVFGQRRRDIFFTGKQTSEESRSFVGGASGHIANKVHTCRAVAVFYGETAAVQCNACAAPCAVQVVREHDHGLALEVADLAACVGC